MRRLRRITIKEEFVRLLGDVTSAMVLDLFMSASEAATEADKSIASEDLKLQGWVTMPASSLAELLFNVESLRSISRKCNALVEAGYLDRRGGVGLDRRHSYRPNLEKITAALQREGFVLSDYVADPPIGQIVQSIGQNVRYKNNNNNTSYIGQIGQSIGQIVQSEVDGIQAPAEPPADPISVVETWIRDRLGLFNMGNYERDWVAPIKFVLEKAETPEAAIALYDRAIQIAGGDNSQNGKVYRITNAASLSAIMANLLRQPDTQTVDRRPIYKSVVDDSGAVTQVFAGWGA